MTTRETPRLLSVTPVKSGREQEFEAFIRDVIVPAVSQHRPHLTGQWQSLRPEDDLHGDGTRAYAFLFYGDAPVDDWLPPAWADVNDAMRAAFVPPRPKIRWRDLLALIAVVVLVAFLLSTVC